MSPKSLSIFFYENGKYKENKPQQISVPHSTLDKIIHKIDKVFFYQNKVIFKMSGKRVTGWKDLKDKLGYVLVNPSDDFNDAGSYLELFEKYKKILEPDVLEAQITQVAPLSQTTKETKIPQKAINPISKNPKNHKLPAATKLSYSQHNMSNRSLQPPRTRQTKSHSSVKSSKSSKCPPNTVRSPPRKSPRASPSTIKSPLKGPVGSSTKKNVAFDVKQAKADYKLQQKVKIAKEKALKKSLKATNKKKGCCSWFRKRSGPKCKCDCDSKQAQYVESIVKTYAAKGAKKRKEIEAASG